MKRPVYRDWPRRALTAGAGFVGVMGLNKAVSSNIPGKSGIHGKGIVHAFWHGSTAQRARPRVAGTGHRRC